MNFCRSPRLFQRSSLASRHRTRFGRLYSSSPADLESWINSLTNKKPEITHDFIDADRCSQLLRVLPTRQPGDYIGDVPAGNCLPPAHHLIFFRPKPMLRDLGPDGSSVVSLSPSVIVIIHFLHMLLITSITMVSDLLSVKLNMLVGCRSRSLPSSRLGGTCRPDC